jgi:hypothetical protein
MRPGAPGFDRFPPFPAPVPAENICLFGIRSVDAAEHAALLDHDDRRINDMRVLDEHGMAPRPCALSDRVAAAGGMLHVSLDVDFLDPADRAGGRHHGARRRHLPRGASGDGDAARNRPDVTSLDLVELNPFLDERGRTAHLMVDLVASLMGRKVFDRPTRSFRRPGDHDMLLHPGPAPSAQALVPFVRSPNMMALVHRIGLERRCADRRPPSRPISAAGPRSTRPRAWPAIPRSG